MDGWTTPVVVAAAALMGCVVLATLLVIVLMRARRQSTALQQESRELRNELLTRIELLEQPLPAQRAPHEAIEFVITEVGDAAPSPEAAPPSRIEGRLFADLVLRESVVKAASWTYGVRTALSAENRNRIRFEMKRESKRSSKQRKADVKEALREYYARQDASAAPSLTSTALAREDQA